MTKKKHADLYNQAFQLVDPTLNYVADIYSLALSDEDFRDYARDFLLCRKHEKEQAIDLLSQILEEDPLNYIALELRAATKACLNMNDEAMLDINKALEIMPDYKNSLTTKAGILHKMGKLEEAAKIYAYVVETKEPSAKAIYNLGLILLKLGNKVDGVLALKTAIKWDPFFMASYEALLKEFIDRDNADAYRAICDAIFDHKKTFVEDTEGFKNESETRETIELTLASIDRIDQYEEIAAHFFENIIGIDYYSCFISDFSCLYVFDKADEETLNKIEEVYGIVPEKDTYYLVDIFEQIREKRNSDKTKN